MPIIRIENVPEIPKSRRIGSGSPEEDVVLGFAELKITEIALNLRSACLLARVPGIDRPEQVTVVQGGKQLIRGDRRIVIVVEGLFDLPTRTNADRDRLAQMLCEAVRSHLPRGWGVEVLVFPWNFVLHGGFAEYAPLEGVELTVGR
ncbi:hypothetical protein HY632_01525 [Candidatus Uhrbacteria bacterium]|nr:hypothetical protein [Candidatus Uhrbacteria bacterium]